MYKRETINIEDWARTGKFLTVWLIMNIISALSGCYDDIYKIKYRIQGLIIRGKRDVRT